MATLSAYPETWGIKLSHFKTVTVAFHFYDREAKCEFNVCSNGKLLPFSPVPIYLGVKLNKSLTFLYHLETLYKELTISVTLLRRLSGLEWGAGAKTLRTFALFLFTLQLSTAHQFGVIAHAPSHRQCSEQRLRIVTGCLRPTPTDHLAIFQT